MEVVRTILFVPGNRPNMMEKARSLPADVLLLDLEDSVPPAEKANAREMTKKVLPGYALAGQRVVVRINSLDTGLAQADLEAVVGKDLDGISMGKVESAQDVHKIDQMVTKLEKAKGVPAGKGRLGLWGETPLAILRAYEICSASPRLLGVAFGADDFTLEMSILRTKEATEQFYPRATIAIAAQAAGILALDTPFVDFKDEEGLIRDTRLARQLGFRGKFVIHPSQIDTVNRLFTPTPEEVAYARQVVEAFDTAAAKGAGSTSLGGQMVDIPSAARARRLLDIAEAIAKKRS